MQRSCGLFPAPYPQNFSGMPHVEKLFQFMGMFFAKCIQDSRIVDLPLSRPLLKMLCMGDVADHISHHLRDFSTWHDWDSSSVKSPCADDDLTPTENTSRDPILDLPKIKPSLSVPNLGGGNQWYAGLLTPDDFELVDPHRARFLDQLRNLSARRQEILNISLDEKQKATELENLTLDNSAVKLEDLRFVTLHYDD